jgi:hypothetical protein
MYHKADRAKIQRFEGLRSGQGTSTYDRGLAISRPRLEEILEKGRFRLGPHFFDGTLSLNDSTLTGSDLLM